MCEFVDAFLPHHPLAAFAERKQKSIFQQLARTVSRQAHYTVACRIWDSSQRPAISPLRPGNRREEM